MQHWMDRNEPKLGGVRFENGMPQLDGNTYSDRNFFMGVRYPIHVFAFF